MNKKHKPRQLRDTWVHDLRASVMRRLGYETAGKPRGSEISADVWLALRVLAPLCWLEEVHRKADDETREALLKCFLLGRDARDLRLGEKFFKNALLGHNLRQAGAKGGRKKAEHLSETWQQTRERICREFNELMTRNPYLSKTSAAGLTARNLKLGRNTVLRALHEMAHAVLGRPSS